MHPRLRRAKDDEVAVVIRCEFCGEEIRLTSAAVGQQIPDADAFLRRHRDCLRAAGEPADVTDPDER